MEGAALIGRDRPAGALQAEISRTIDSHGGLVLIAGEAGIGKTALVVAAMEEARRRGALVLSAACWEREGAPGYWPWVQVVRNLERTAAPHEWHGARAAAGDALSFLLGEASEAPRPARSETGGFRLYDAVTTLLVTASRSRPVVVVLEDLHWADPASVKLLDFVVRHSWFERLLAVSTYRDEELEAAGHLLGRLILPLAAHATTVMLTGLDRDSVGLLMARTAGRAPDEDLVAEVARMIGSAIGRPDLPYLQIPEDDLRAALEAEGWSPDATRLQVEMNRVFSDGSVAARATRTAASTTPTRFEDYAAADLAPAFAAVAVNDQ